MASFDQLYALTTLAHKYQIEAVEKEAIEHIKSHYYVHYNGPVTFASQPELGQGIGVIQLARLTDNPSLLPLAFYRCAMLGGRVAQGWTREDGSVMYLSPDDLQRCINGYAWICRKVEKRIRRVFTPEPSQSCPTRDECHRSATALCDALLRDQNVRRNFWRDLFGGLGYFIPEWTEKFPVCAAASRESEVGNMRGKTASV